MLPVGKPSNYGASVLSLLTLCDPTNCSHQAPLSMEFPRQQYWTGLPLPPPVDPPNPGIKPTSPSVAGRFFTIWATWEAQAILQHIKNYCK